MGLTSPGSPDDSSVRQRENGDERDATPMQRARPAARAPCRAQAGSGRGIGAAGCRPRRRPGRQPTEGAAAEERSLRVRRRRTEGQLITLADLPAGGPPLTAYPMDPTARVVRDDSRLNQVLLVRLDPNQLNGDTRARAADGIVAYSAVCTHTGCDIWDWQPASGTVKCPCHFSEFDLKESARVLNGPAPRRLPALPLKIVDGMPAVAGGFVGRPGFETGGG